MRPDRAIHRPEHRFRRLESQGSMRALTVVVRHELAQHRTKVLFIQDNEVVDR
jgi:hypothetical protein